MPLTPNESDTAAGFTETLTAVAIRWYDPGSTEQIPWVDLGSAGIGAPGDVDRWLRELPDWDEADIHYQVYVVPEDQYRPLTSFGITGLQELGTFEFLATREAVAKVRNAERG